MAVGDTAKSGVDTLVAVQHETTYGTFALTTTALHPLQPNSVSIKTEFDTEKLDSIGRGRGFSHQVQKDKKVSGSIDMFLHPEESTRLIINAMGGQYTFTSLTGAGDFSITTANGNFSSSETLTSLSVYVRKGDTHGFRYAGGVINSLKISAAVNEPVKLSAEFVFQDSSMASGDNLAANFSYSTIAPFIYADGRYYYDKAEGSLTSSVAEPIQSFELEIKNNLVTDAKARQLGSRLLSRIPPATRREVSFKISQRFDTTTAFDRFVQNTNGSVMLDFSGASITVEFGRRMQIVMPLVRMKGADPVVEGADAILSSDIEFDVLMAGIAGTTTSKELAITLRNSIVDKI